MIRWPCGVGLVTVMLLTHGNAVAQGPSLPLTVIDADTTQLRVQAVVPFVLEITRGASTCPRWTVDLLVESAGPDTWMWLSSTSATAVDADTTATTVFGVSERRSLLLTRCEGRAGYDLYGPFRWPSRPSAAGLAFRRRRTVIVSGGHHPMGQVALAVAADAGDPWPHCRRLGPGRVECLGLPADLSAVAVSRGPLGVAWAPVPVTAAASQRVSLRTVAWGRVLRAPATVTSTEMVTRAWWEPRSPMGTARHRIRLVQHPSVSVVPFAAGSWWVMGHDESTDGLVEVTATGAATLRIPLRVLRTGAAEDPFVIALAPELPVSGTVRDQDGRPVPDAVVSAFEPVGSAGESLPRIGPGEPRWRWMAETRAGAQGQFGLAGLRRGVYQIVAVHPVAGRVVESRRLDGTTVSLQLVSTRRIRGRVLVEGVPTVGVVVQVRPDRWEFAQAADPLAHLAPSAWTDPHGRFTLSLPRGAGEVIIGGNGVARVRHRFGGSDDQGGTTDLGDILVPAPREVGVRLIAPGCALLATGPVGSLGVEIVTAVFDPGRSRYRLLIPEPGFWWLEARCGTEWRAVGPPVIHVPDDGTGHDFEVSLAPENGTQPPAAAEPEQSGGR